MQPASSFQGTIFERITPPQAYNPTALRYSRSLVLNCPQDCSAQIAPLLANFILDGVQHIHLAGPDGGKVKRLIEAILTKGGFNVPITSIWYEGETLQSVIAFAHSYCHQPPGGMQVVHL